MVVGIRATLGDLLMDSHESQKMARARRPGHFYCVTALAVLAVLCITVGCRLDGSAALREVISAASSPSNPAPYEVNVRDVMLLGDGAAVEAAVALHVVLRWEEPQGDADVVPSPKEFRIHLEPIGRTSVTGQRVHMLGADRLYPTEHVCRRIYMHFGVRPDGMSPTKEAVLFLAICSDGSWSYACAPPGPRWRSTAGAEPESKSGLEVRVSGPGKKRAAVE